MEKIERILIFELNWLGDILFSLPFLRVLREAFPKAYIAAVVVPRYVDLLVDNPHINDVHVLSDDNGIGTIREKLEFIGMIKKEKYDACFFLKPSRTKAVMALMAGIKERIGFEGKRSPLTRIEDRPSPDLHRVDQILSLAGTVGVNEADGTYEYFVSEYHMEKAREVLHDSGGGLKRIVVLNTGGNWELKKWPYDCFVDLAKKLLANMTDIEIMIPGAKKDIGPSIDIVDKVASSRCYTVAGKTGLNELAALFKMSSLVISADSGPLHLASSVGAVTLGLFGPTSYKITGPRGKNRSIIIQKDVGCDIPCYVETCEKSRKCMSAITVDEVFSAAEELLAGGGTV